MYDDLRGEICVCGPYNRSKEVAEGKEDGDEDDSSGNRYFEVDPHVSYGAPIY